jgi:hypothetical protein
LNFFGFRSSFFMQRTIAFPRITAEEAAQQRQRMVAAYADTHPALPPPPPKRPPGRPKRPRPLQKGKEEEEKSDEQEKRQNTNWFSTPFIFDVIAAYKQSGYSAKGALKILRCTCLVPGRYSQLSDSTIRSWFDDKHQLLPRFQEQLDAGKASQRQGRQPVMSNETEEAIKETIIHLRDSGTPINAHVVRWTMLAIFNAIQLHAQ